MRTRLGKSMKKLHGCTPRVRGRYTSKYSTTVGRGRHRSAEGTLGDEKATVRLISASDRRMCNGPSVLFVEEKSLYVIHNAAGATLRLVVGDRAAGAQTNLHRCADACCIRVERRPRRRRRSRPMTIIIIIKIMIYYRCV